MKDRNIDSVHKNERVRTALLLAAGTGSRLSPLTDETPKCLVSVNKKSILERLINSLQEHNFKRLVVVVGHQADCIRNFLGTRAGGMEITYITSSLYKTTNNIYSLWLARKVINEPFLLIESDLVFDPEMLKDMLRPDRIAISKLQPWMNGTTVTINNSRKVEAFHADDTHKHDSNQYKTVNIYSLSTATWRLVRKRLERQISDNMVNGYYETVFSDMVDDGCLSLTTVLFKKNRWYEIDTITDLRAAEQVCDLPRHSSVIPVDQRADNPKGLRVVPPSASKPLTGYNRIKKGPSRQTGTAKSAPMQSASPVPIH